uniref:DUF4175 family protein n=1 Tax=Schlesneria paludicola TaxID=360056 RepID=A0A7C2PBJ7_9PLAN
MAELPPVVTERLTVVERKWRELVWLRGWGIVLGVAAGGLAALLIADAYLNLPGWLRGCGLCATGVLTLLVIWRRLVRPWLVGMTLADAAEWVERAHPELQERVLTCLDLEQARDAAPASRAALLMRRQVRRETLQLLDDVADDAALPPEPAFRTFGLGLVFLAILIAPFGIWTTGYALGWQRLFHPTGNHAWGRNWIVAGQPGDQIHPRGQDLTVVAVAQHRRSTDRKPESLTLHWRTAGVTEWDTRRLTHDAASQTFIAAIPHLSADTEWFVTGPASASPRYRITVVDPPQITQVLADVDPLPYTGQPSTHGPVGGELTALIGSVIRLELHIDRPIAAADVSWPALASKPATPEDGALTAKPFALSADRRTAIVRLRAEQSGPFQFTLRSPEGLVVTEEPRRIVVTPDEPPRVQLAGGSTVTLRPDERLEATITAHDDFGLQVSELQVMLSEQDVRRIPLIEREAAGREWLWMHALDVAELGLTNGQAVTLRARVVDNRAWPSPQESWSDPQVLVISQSAPSAAERALAAQTNAARHDLQELLRELAEHRNELKAVHQQTAAATVKQRDVEQAAKLADLAARQQELTDQLGHWADDLPAGGPWQQMRAAAEDVIDNQLAAANSELEQGREAETRDQIEHLSRTLDELAAAQRALQRLDDAIRALGNLGEELGELAQLANRSDRLADELERGSRESANQSPDLAEPVGQSEQLLQDLNRLIEDRPELKAALEQALRVQAAAKAERAKALAERQQQLAEAIRGDAASPPETDGPPAAPETTPTDSSSRAADASRPANAPAPPASPEFAAGRSLSEQLQRAAEASSRLAESLLDELGPDAAPVTSAVEAARDLHAARDAAAQGQLPVARDQTARAAEQLQQAANSFPEAAAQTPPAQQTQQLAQTVEQLRQQLEPLSDSPAARQGSLAAAQEQLASATTELAQSQQQSGQPPSPEQPSSQQRADQQQPNQPPSTAKPSDQPPPGQPPAMDKPSSPAQQALAAAQEAMQQTQQALQAGDSGQAADEAQHAAEQLAQAAEKLQPPPPNPPQPTENAAPTETGEALSKAEQKLLAGQQQLRECANCQNPGSQPGGRMAQSQGNGQPPSGQAPTDQPSSRSAQTAPENSGREPTGQQPAGPQPSPTGAPQPSPDGKSSPSGMPVPETMSQAIADFRQAGDALRQAVESLAGQPRSPTQFAQPQPGTFRAPSQNAQASDQPAELALPAGPGSLARLEQKLQAASQRNWGRLSGKLQTEILEGGQLPVHPEYARQIQKYFQTIAQPAGESVPTSK